MWLLKKFKKLVIFFNHYINSTSFDNKVNHLTLLAWKKAEKPPLPSHLKALKKYLALPLHQKNND